MEKFLQIKSKNNDETEPQGSAQAPQPKRKVAALSGGSENTTTGKKVKLSGPQSLGALIPTPTLSVFYQSKPDLITGLLRKYSATDRVRFARDWCKQYRELARYVLSQYSGDKVVTDGWCRRVQLVGNQHGYPQPSYWGANHIAEVHHLVLWADGLDIAPGDQGSHLCHRVNCKTLGHVTSEDIFANNHRKGCVVWSDCPCGSGKKYLICRSRPPCIKYCLGFDSQGQFLAEGVCHYRGPGDQCLAFRSVAEL